jgi:hypothetical protein
MEKSSKLIIFGLILGAAFIVGTYLVSQTFLAVKKMDNIISVSGSAKQLVTADNARWTGNFSRTVAKDALAEGYALMRSDEKAVTDFFQSEGFSGQFEISPIFMNEVYKSDPNAPKEYNLIQNIEIKSTDVNKTKGLAKKTEILAQKGIIFSAYPVEYYYSKLPEVRVSLLPEAIKDAKNRAESIAQSSGKTVDSIKSVSMGVVQVMTAGAVDVSDYGSYDTSAIEKEIMITVKTTFNLK